MLSRMCRPSRSASSYCDVTIGLRELFTSVEPLLFIDIDAGRRLTDSDRALIDQACSGTHLAFTIRIDHGTRLMRVARLLFLGTRVTLLERAVVSRGGIALEGCFGVYPSLESPTLAFQLDTVAAVYAGIHLLPDSNRGATATLRRGFARWTGYDPALGALVVLAKKL